MIVLAKVSREHYPDPTAKGEDWSAVDIVAVKALKRFVTLSQMKNDPLLKNIALVKQSRLSVSPLTKAEFDRIITLAAT